MTATPGGTGPVVPAELAQELTELLGWFTGDAELTAVRWQFVGDAIERIHAGLTLGDWPAARSAMDDLELIGPMRANTLGGSVEPPPQHVWLRIDQLVHRVGGALDGIPTPEQERPHLDESR